MPNTLAEASSPYLLQHKDNPVAWREWRPEVLAEARAADKPILLSIGYAACHWCHVMAHESFENPDIAALMNEHFVCIKVDREERPDLDGIYQHALAMMGQQGGWPLTMFLAPDGEPFWGGTYFPPEPRHGRPGFPQVLQQVSELWRTGRDRVRQNRIALREGLESLARPTPGDLPGRDIALRVARDIAEEFDTIHGGLGGAPKFPQAPALRLIWQMAVAGNDPVMAARVRHTLARMCQGGIFDHLGGGFSRYAVDSFWLVPHFEKMLYDNAQILELLGEVHAATGDPLFEACAERTVGWLQREMLTPDGFAASIDADSEGEEGRFYVWTAEEIDELLGEDAPMFRLAHGVTAKGNWEGRTILNRLHEPGLPEPEIEAKLAPLRQKLLEARDKRVRPALDDKILADWNGLAIAALVQAGRRFDRPEWLELAATVFGRVTAFLGDGDRLAHSGRDGRKLGIAFLDDYAQMMRAALALHAATGEAAWLDKARAWADVAERDFGAADGSFHLATEAASDLIVRPRNAHDGPVPSAAGSLALALLHLSILDGAPERARRAERLIAAFAGEIDRNPFAHVTLLAAASFAEEPLQIVLSGKGEARAELTSALRRTALPEHILIESPEALPGDHPAAGQAQGSLAAAHVCRGPVCLPPATDPQALRRLLRYGK